MGTEALCLENKSMIWKSLVELTFLRQSFAVISAVEGFKFWASGFEEFRDSGLLVLVFDCIAQGLGARV